MIGSIGGVIGLVVESPLEEGLDGVEEIKEETPLEKIGKPEDIAKCIEWLVEDNFTTGQVISINGGWVIT